MIRGIVIVNGNGSAVTAAGTGKGRIGVSAVGIDIGAVDYLILAQLYDLSISAAGFAITAVGIEGAVVALFDMNQCREIFSF